MDLAQIERRPQQPGAQQTLAHRCDRAINGPEQRQASIRAREQWFDQLQIANRNRVEHEAALSLVPADSVDMVQRPTLRGPHVIQNRARGGCSCRPASQAESFQRQNAKMIFQQWYRMIGGENPTIQWSLGTRTCRRPRLRS